MQGEIVAKYTLLTGQKKCIFSGVFGEETIQ